jgi:GNAT superfamily N-acetyltransferase
MGARVGQIAMIIRDATPADHAAWLTLWAAFLDFYKTTLPPQVTAFTWARLMDPASSMKMRLAVVDDHPQAFAIHQHHPSTWVMGDDCYLEDLFVAPDQRSQGLGRALINDLTALAKSRGWNRLYWHTDEANTNARRLYDSFVKSDGHIRYRFTLT